MRALKPFDLATLILNKLISTARSCFALCYVMRRIATKLCVIYTNFVCEKLYGDVAVKTLVKFMWNMVMLSVWLRHCSRTTWCDCVLY